jgi:hypothetical protein
MLNEEVSAVNEKEYGPVAQWIEQRFPKPLVGGSTPPGASTLQTRASSGSTSPSWYQSLLGLLSDYCPIRKFAAQVGPCLRGHLC